MQEPTVTDPMVSVGVEWNPVGPDAFEASLGGVDLQVKKIGEDRWRWSLEGPSGLLAGGGRESRDAAMAAAIASVAAGGPAAAS